MTGARGDGLAVIRRRARRLAVPLTEVEPAPLLGWDRDGIEIELPRLGRTRIGLRGRHQAANAAIADATLDALEAAGIATVPDEARRRGYANAVWPGRLELLRAAGRDVLLDGAHNPAGAAALAASLDDLRPYLAPGPITLVTASMADKDVAGVVAALAALRRAGGLDRHLHEPSTSRAPCRPPTWPRSGGRPASRARSSSRTTRSTPPRPPSSPSRPGTVLIAGSLYLVGAARSHLVDDPDLRDPEPDHDPVP